MAGGDTTTRRPISNFTSIGSVDASGLQVDMPGMLAGLPPIATDASNFASSLKEFEQTFQERNESSLRMQQAEPANVAEFSAVAAVRSEWAKTYANQLAGNVPAAPGVTIWDPENPLAWAGINSAQKMPLSSDQLVDRFVKNTTGQQLVHWDGIVRENGVTNVSVGSPPSSLERCTSP